MSATVLPAATGGAAITWTLLGSVTPNNTVNTYTFSGLSGYKQYRLVTKVNFATADEPSIKINSLGGSTYSYNVRSLLNTTWATSLNNNSAEIRVNAGGTANTAATDFVVDDMPNSKSATFAHTGLSTNTGMAIVALTTAITSLTYNSLGGANFSAGTISIYGGN